MIDASQWLAIDQSAAGQARKFCEDQLRHTSLPESTRQHLIDTAKLIASELATNAVAAGATAVQLRLKAAADALNWRIEVDDNAAGQPQPRRASPRDSDGRGLAIVVALSSSWGIEPRPLGKTVWAQFGLG